MKIGFLFPGQGSQSVGMGKDIYEEYEEARKIYEEVQNITKIDIAKISFEGEEEILNQTKYTQLAILTESLAILEILKQNGIKAEISAGLSLGEYSALINSNALSFEEGVKIVKKRGEYMQDLLPKGEWQMAAIMGLSDEQVVEEAEAIAKEMGAKKVRVLKTAGPFHTEKLKESSDALRKELENVTINKFETKVIKNLDGDFYKDTDNVKEILASHIVNPVRFSKTIKTMLDNGIDIFIEIGPGKTLSGFVKRTPTDKEVKILNINDVQTLKETIKEIGGN